MTQTPSDNRRRLVAGAALVAAPAVLLSADAAVLIFGREEHLVRGAPGFVIALMLPAILGLTHLLRERADRLGLAGGALCLVGTYAAARMSTLFQLDGLLHAGVEGVPAESVRSALDADALFFASVFPPGLCFPIGLLVLAAGLVVSRTASRPVAAVLALGAVLFPVGRIGGLPPAVIASDALMLVAMALIGWRVLARPGNWAQAVREETDERGRGRSAVVRSAPPAASSGAV